MLCASRRTTLLWRGLTRQTRHICSGGSRQGTETHCLPRRSLIMSGSDPANKVRPEPPDADPRPEPAKSPASASKEEPKPQPRGDASAEVDRVREGQGQKGGASANKGWFGGFRRYFSQPKRDRSFYENLPLDEKRALYSCGKKYQTLDNIPAWSPTGSAGNRPKKAKLHPDSKPLFSTEPELNEKVSLWRGDITTLEIDAIVNAANSSLMGGGGVDGAIHKAAGWSLMDECEQLGGCDTGDTKLTSGHRLPAKYILHTVGPMNRSKDKLKSCYETSLQLVVKHKIRTVAFSCISTGVYGFPNEAAAHVALETVRQWLETDNNAEKVDRVIFCVFLEKDLNIYWRLLHQYFPLPGETSGSTEGGVESAEGKDMEMEGGTPPPESPEGPGKGDGDGGRSGVPPAPRLEHHATAPARTSQFEDKPSTLPSPEERPEESKEMGEDRNGEGKEVGGNDKEGGEVKEEATEVAEETMDTSCGGGSPRGSNTEGENEHSQPGSDQQPATLEAENTSKKETEI